MRLLEIRIKSSTGIHLTKKKYTLKKKTKEETIKSTMLPKYED